tara:strand:+ start:1024 stop:2637 length:1614 start_codon:yes stop_codon:yes gene_type:complete
MAGYGGESGTGGVAGGGGGAPSLDVRRMRTNQNQPFSQQIGDGAISSGGKQLLNLTQRVDSSDIALFSADEDKGKSVLPAARNLRFNNLGDSALGVSLKLNHWSSGTAEDAEPNKYIHFIVGKGESLNMPITRMIASDNSAIDSGTAVSNTAPDGNMYTDSGADVDTATDGAIGSGTTTTTLYLEEGHSKYFRVGDLIRLENEICEVTAVGTGADLASSTCTIIRAVHGSTAATHADDVAVRFPFFNAYHDFDKFSTARTDNDGKFKAFNLFGYGRATDAPTSGILPGSVAIKCYNPGYQELGLSGITPGTNSGLTAGETYYFFCNVDGGGAGDEVSFTVDASNTNFGGRNGVLSKIQAFFNQKYYTSGATLFEKKVTVGIVNGDIRFTSGSYLSTSSIALTEGTSGAGVSVRWFGHSVNPTGRIPGSNNLPSPVAARLPDDTITDNTTGETMSNTGGFMYDDGKGRLVGNGSGTINYDTGAIDFVSKPNAEFVVSLVHTSALSGKVTETTKNTIEEIKVRSMNAKITGKINLVVEG